MKLELEKLVCYLPYGLMALVTDQRFNNGFAFLDKITGVYEDLVTFNDSPDWYFDSDENDTEIKLALRPLSDLTKEIEHNGEKFVPALQLVKLKEKYGKWKDIAPTIDYDVRIVQKPFGKALKVTKCDQWVIYMSLNEIERQEYFIVQKLLEWHFDVFGLIEKGLAIDINTLENV